MSKWAVPRATDEEIALKKELNKMQDEMKKYKVQMRRQEKLAKTRPSQDNKQKASRRNPVAKKEENNMIDTLQVSNDGNQKEIQRLRALLRLQNIGAKHPGGGGVNGGGKKKHQSIKKKNGGKRRPGSARPSQASSAPANNEVQHQNERDYFKSLQYKLENRIANSREDEAYPRTLTGGPGHGNEYDPNVVARGMQSFVNNHTVDHDFVSEGGVRELYEVRRELREKKARITLLQSQYEQMAVAFRAEKDIQKHTLQQCNNLKHKVAELQKDNRTQKRRIEDLSLGSNTIGDQELIIEDLRAEVVTLQEQASLLTQNLFEGDQIEKARMKKVLNENAYQIQKLEEELRSKSKKNELLSTELRQKEVVYHEQKEFILHITKEKTSIQKELEERMKQLTHALDRLALFSADSGVDMNDLEEALDMIKRKREDPTFIKGLTTVGGSLEKMDEFQLKRKINELELQNKEMIRELQLAQDLVSNAKDHHRLSKRQFHQNNENLSKAAADAAQRVKDLEAENTLLKTNAAYRPGAEGDLDDSIFENSESEFGELNGLENLVAFRVLKADLNKDFALFKGNNPPITFLGSDFFAFKTNFSSLFGGFKPQYNFTAQYPVVVDGFFIQCLENDTLRLEMFKKLNGMDAQMVGFAEIPLKALMSRHASIQGSIRVMCDDEDIPGTKHVATITYVLRMRRAINDQSDPGSDASTLDVRGRYRDDSDADSDVDRNRYASASEKKQSAKERDERRDARIERRRSEKNGAKHKDMQKRLADAVAAESTADKKKSSYTPAEHMPSHDAVEKKNHGLPLPLPLPMPGGMDDLAGDLMGATPLLDLKGATKNIKAFDVRLFVTLQACNVCDVEKLFMNHTSKTNRPFTPFTLADDMSVKQFYLSYRNYGVDAGKTDDIPVYIAETAEADFHSLYDNKTEVVSIKETDAPAHGKWLGRFHLPLSLIARMSQKNNGSITAQEFPVYPAATHKKTSIGFVTVSLSWAAPLLKPKEAASTSVLLPGNSKHSKKHKKHKKHKKKKSSSGGGGDAADLLTRIATGQVDNASSSSSGSGSDSDSDSDSGSGSDSGSTRRSSSSHSRKPSHHRAVSNTIEDLLATSSHSKAHGVKSKARRSKKPSLDRDASEMLMDVLDNSTSSKSKKHKKKHKKKRSDSSGSEDEAEEENFIDGLLGNGSSSRSSGSRNKKKKPSRSSSKRNSVASDSDEVEDATSLIDDLISASTKTKTRSIKKHKKKKSTTTEADDLMNELFAGSKPSSHSRSSSRGSVKSKPDLTREATDVLADMFSSSPKTKSKPKHGREGSRTKPKMARDASSILSDALLSEPGGNPSARGRSSKASENSASSMLNDIIGNTPPAKPSRHIKKKASFTKKKSSADVLGSIIAGGGSDDDDSISISDGDFF